MQKRTTGACLVIQRALAFSHLSNWSNACTKSCSLSLESQKGQIIKLYQYADFFFIFTNVKTNKSLTLFKDVLDSYVLNPSNQAITLYQSLLDKAVLSSWLIHKSNQLEHLFPLYMHYIYYTISFSVFV